LKFDLLTPLLVSIHLLIATEEAPVRGFNSKRAALTSSMVEGPDGVFVLVAMVDDFVDFLFPCFCW
jgi:hypothetical protein